MKKVLLVGDYDHEVQRTELVREEQKLRDAGYEVRNICDIAVDPDSGEPRLPTSEIHDLVHRLVVNTNIDIVANYFTDESPLSRYALEVANKHNITIRCSANLWWTKQHMPTHYGMWYTMMRYLDKVSAMVLSNKGMKSRSGS